MTAGEWIALIALVVTILGGLGWVFLFLSARIDIAEKASKDYAAELMHEMWRNAEKHFATKADMGRLEGKIDAILIHIEYLRSRHERDN